MYSYGQFGNSNQTIMQRYGEWEAAASPRESPGMHGGNTKTLQNIRHWHVCVNIDDQPAPVLPSNGTANLLCAITISGQNHLKKRRT